MWHVEQRHLWRPDDHPDGPQRGDCVAACLASIFEMPYEDCAEVQGDSQGVFKWTRKHFPGVRAETRVLRPLDGPERIGDHVNWLTGHHEQGYWMAAIWSPRIPDREMTGCGCTDRTDGAGDPDCEWCHGRPAERNLGILWGLHAVVMFNDQLVWDPHPDADPNATLYFNSATTWYVEDPARLTPRCRKGACGEDIIDQQDCYHRKAA